MFDLRSDPREITNLIKGREKVVAMGARPPPSAAVTGAAGSSRQGGQGTHHGVSDGTALFTPANILANVRGVRASPELHKWLFSRMYAAMKDYADHGNAADLIYRSRNHGRHYNATVESNVRRVGNQYKGTTRAEAQNLRVKTIDQGYCATACPCDTPRAGDVAAFPVDEVASSLKYIMPRYPEGFVDSNSLLRQ